MDKLFILALIYIILNKDSPEMKLLYEFLWKELEEKSPHALSRLGTIIWKSITWKQIMLLVGVSWLDSLVKYVVRNTFETLLYHEATHVNAPPLRLPRFSMFQLANTLARRGTPMVIPNCGYTALRVDSIARSLGLCAAEKYFALLPEVAKDAACYNSLFRWYCKELKTAKAEALVEGMRTLGFPLSLMAYNSWLALCLKTHHPERIPGIIEDMMNAQIEFSSFTYNAWIQGMSALNDTTGVQSAIRELDNHGRFALDWTTHLSLAPFYINAGLVSRARASLLEVERNCGSNLDMKPFLVVMYRRMGDMLNVLRLEMEMSMAR